MKNALAHYNAGVVVENSNVLRLGPGFESHVQCMQEIFFAVLVKRKKTPLLSK
jgi:hypothetical protein